MIVFVHSIALARRHLHSVTRQYVVSAFVQPMLGLVLYGQLFHRMTEVSGFGSVSYISFVVPGFVVMTALFTGGANAVGQLREMNTGVLDRFLVSPTSALALIGGRSVATAVITLSQSAALLCAGWMAGARLTGGATAVAVLLVAAVMLAIASGTMAICMALLIRPDESVVAFNSLLMQAMALTSPVFVASRVMPASLQVVARLNPVSWAVESARAVGTGDFVYVATRLACLAAFAATCVLLTVRVLNKYRNSR